MSLGGGSSTTVQELPAWLEKAAQENLDRARMTADIGYTPYYGLDVAGFSPMQQQAMQNTGSMAQAFGMAPAGFDAMAGMPQTTTNNLGFTGYSSGNMFDQAQAELASRRPAQYQAIESLFTDPYTGAASVPTIQNVINQPTATAGEILALAGTGGSGGGSASDVINASRQDRYNQTRAFLDNMNNGGIGNLSLLGHVMKPLAQSWVWNEQNEATKPQGFLDFLTRSDGDVVLGDRGTGGGSLVTGSSTSGTGSSFGGTTSYGTDYSGSTGSAFDASDFTSDYGSGLSGDTASIGVSSSNTDNSGYGYTADTSFGDYSGGWY